MHLFSFPAFFESYIMSPANISSRWLWSTASLALLLYAQIKIWSWHSSLRNRPVLATRLLIEIEDTPIIDDDITRDETCRQYLMNFMNGTTDFKDECQAMYNAYQAADCKDQGTNGIAPIVGRHHQTKDGNVTDDDMLIDDIFENFECCSSIESFYNKHCQEQSLNASRLFGILLVLVVCGLMKSLIRQAQVQWIPDAGACVIVGAIVGGILRLADPSWVRTKLIFNSDLFLRILLPPIIFEAAVSIDKRAFRRDLFPILTFAIFGTGFTALVIGLLTFYLSGISGGISLPWLDSLSFGALMSSIDPVATLGILSAVGVGHSDTLYTLIFGESLLNDGVSIVLFDSLIRHMGDAGVVDSTSVQDTLFDFLSVITGSILIGVTCGICCTFFFWIIQGKQTAVSEVALFFTWANIPYYLADGWGYSGIISIMVMGFMMDYFIIGGFQSEERQWMDYIAFRGEVGASHPIEPSFARFRNACCNAFSGGGHLASRSRHHVGFVAKVISSIMETAIFAYLGLFLFNSNDWNMILAGTGIFSCVSSRAAMVVIFSILVNFCVWINLEGRLGRLCESFLPQNRNRNDDDSRLDNNRVYLDKKTQLILFSAGVRGAVSYSLVQNIPVYDSVTKTGSHYKGELKAMTSATIVTILFTFGALTYFIVQYERGSRARTGPTSEPLQERLLSLTLTSDIGDDESRVDLNSSFEIDSDPVSRRQSTDLHLPES